MTLLLSRRARRGTDSSAARRHHEGHEEHEASKVTSIAVGGPHGVTEALRNERVWIVEEHAH